MAHGEERTYSHGTATHRRRRCRLRHVAAIAEARRKGGGADARGVEDAPLPARQPWQAGAERRAAAARPRRRAFPQDDRRRDCDMPPAAEAARRRCGGGNPHGQARGIHNRLSGPFTNCSSPRRMSASPSQGRFRFAACAYPPSGASREAGSTRGARPPYQCRRRMRRRAARRRDMYMYASCRRR